MPDVLVRKLNLEGQETWRYTGQIVRQDASLILLEAEFNHADMLVQEVPFLRGDRFIEAYYTDRWYNVYEVHDRLDGRIKCWYCNVSLPAEVDGGEIRYVDLALDLFVYPDGRQRVLDEDEFEELNPPPELRAKALQALEELKRLVRPQEGYRVGSSINP